MAKAERLLSLKKVYRDGAILQMTLWRLPQLERVRGSAHGFKYSLFYGRPGRRILSYDNEAGKGDHIHRGAAETPYIFVSPDRLVANFLEEVTALRGGRL